MRAVRVWIDENLLPEAPPPPALTIKRMLIAAAVALFVIVIQLVRVWSSLPLQSIWAEDGSVWLTDSLNRGFFDTLVTPFNGYLQSAGRLVAEPVSYLPVESYAPLMAIAGAAITTGCVFIVWRASAGHIRNTYLRVGLAAMIVLLPVVGLEPLANVTNSTWFMLFASFWVLLWRPSTMVRAAAAAAFLFLAAVSSGGLIILLPVWILRLVAIRDRRDAIIVGAFAAGLAVQVGLSWPERNLLGEEGGPRVALESDWDWDLIPAYAQRVIGGALFGESATGVLWESLGWVIVVVLASALVAFVATSIMRGDRLVRAFVPLAVVISLALFLTAGFQRWNFGGSLLFWPEGESTPYVTRYVVAPTLLLLSALFVFLDRTPPTSRTARWRVGIPLVVAAFAMSSFSVGDRLARGAPTWSNALDRSRAECASTGAVTEDVAISPVTYEVVIPCTKLGG